MGKTAMPLWNLLLYSFSARESYQGSNTTSPASWVGVAALGDSTVLDLSFRGHLAQRQSSVQDGTCMPSD